MRIVFWQNCLSPHQLPYIARLMDDDRVDEVVVVAGEDVSADRRSMGWQVASYDGLERCSVIVKPDEQTANSLFAMRQEDSHHLFSGIRADRFVFECLKRSMGFNLKRSIITERPNRYDFKRNIRNAKPYWLHRIRFFLQDRTFAKSIDSVFAMGDEAVAYYKSLGMNWKVFPFCYCTESQQSGGENCSADRQPEFIFCGSLSPRKSPVVIVEALKCLDQQQFGHVTFVGGGPLRTSIEESVATSDLREKVLLVGSKQQTETQTYMAKADVLILPSLYDGWGAVVNEALQSGCYVICSDECGASDMIREDSRLGLVFKAGDVRQLSQAISFCCNNISEIRTNRNFRIAWADEHISGSAVAKYMVDCLTCVLRQAPWK